LNPARVDRAVKLVKMIKNQSTVYADLVTTVARTINFKNDINKAINIALEISNDHYKSEALACIALNCGNLDKALEVVKMIPEDKERDRILNIIAQQYPSH